MADRSVSQRLLTAATGAAKRTGKVAIWSAAGASLGLAALLLKRAYARHHEEDLRGQVVVITGGSRGLGLQLARDFAQQGCRLAICARDRDELDRAYRDLTERGAEVWSCHCDVTDPEQIDHFVRGTLEHFGSINIVVANAGIIRVGPAEVMQREDFQDAMDTMFWGVFHTIMAALPHMKERGSGHIVTITSVGGKISVPHLLPYSCAKFAAVALSEGLRPELAPSGIKVHTIIPGLMRTGSHLNAQFKGDAPREFAWFGLGASLPLVSISIESASRQIVESVRQGTSERILGLPAQLAARVHALAPALSSTVLEWVNRLILPHGTQVTAGAVRGVDADRQLNSRLFRALTSLGTSAAHRMNEL